MNSSCVTIAEIFEGPPGIAHGGHIAGHFAEVGATVQVTLRQPTPLDTELELLHAPGGRGELRLGEDLLVEAEPASLDVEVPDPADPDAIEAAEPLSPSHADGRGVHPMCFGCGLQRPDRSGLRIAAAPVDVGGRAQVAAMWSPPADLAGDGGSVDLRHVIAALDCPGAFSFMVDGERPGLLGRMTFEVLSETPVGEPHIVTGWRIGSRGVRMLAGTALFSGDGELRARASAIWFPFPA